MRPAPLCRVLLTSLLAALAAGCPVEEEPVGDPPVPVITFDLARDSLVEVGTQITLRASVRNPDGSIPEAYEATWETEGGIICRSVSQRRVEPGTEEIVLDCHTTGGAWIHLLVISSHGHHTSGLGQALEFLVQGGPERELLSISTGQTLAVGERRPLVVVPFSRSQPNEVQRGFARSTVTYRSNAPSVFSVDADGVVTGLAPGSGMLMMSTPKNTTSIPVVVNTQPLGPPRAPGIYSLDGFLLPKTSPQPPMRFLMMAFQPRYDRRGYPAALGVPLGQGDGRLNFAPHGYPVYLSRWTGTGFGLERVSHFDDAPTRSRDTYNDVGRDLAFDEASDPWVVWTTRRPFLANPEVHGLRAVIAHRPRDGGPSSWVRRAVEPDLSVLTAAYGDSVLPREVTYMGPVHLLPRQGGGVWLAFWTGLAVGEECEEAVWLSEVTETEIKTELVSSLHTTGKPFEVRCFDNVGQDHFDQDEALVLVSRPGGERPDVVTRLFADTPGYRILRRTSGAWAHVLGGAKAQAYRPTGVDGVIYPKRLAVARAATPGAQEQIVFCQGGPNQAGLACVAPGIDRITPFFVEGPAEDRGRIFANKVNGRLLVGGDASLVVSQLYGPGMWQRLDYPTEPFVPEGGRLESLYARMGGSIASGDQFAMLIQGASGTQYWPTSDIAIQPAPPVPLSPTSPEHVGFTLGERARSWELATPLFTFPDGERIGIVDRGLGDFLEAVSFANDDLHVVRWAQPGAPFQIEPGTVLLRNSLRRITELFPVGGDVVGLDTQYLRSWRTADRGRSWTELLSAPLPPDRNPPIGSSMDAYISPGGTLWSLIGEGALATRSLQVRNILDGSMPTYHIVATSIPVTPLQFAPWNAQLGRSGDVATLFVPTQSPSGGTLTDWTVVLQQYSASGLQSERAVTFHPNSIDPVLMPRPARMADGTWLLGGWQGNSRTYGVWRVASGATEASFIPFNPRIDRIDLLPLGGQRVAAVYTRRVLAPYFDSTNVPTAIEWRLSEDGGQTWTAAAPVSSATGGFQRLVSSSVESGNGALLLVLARTQQLSSQAFLGYAEHVIVRLPLPAAP